MLNAALQAFEGTGQQRLIKDAVENKIVNLFK